MTSDRWVYVESKESGLVVVADGHWQAGAQTQYAFKAGVGYLRRNYGWGPPWVRAKALPAGVRELLDGAPCQE